MQSSRRTPSPPAHAPRLEKLKQSTLKDALGVTNRQRAKITPLSESEPSVEDKAETHSRLPARDTSANLLSILTRRRATVVPTESAPSLEEKTGVRSVITKKPAYQTTQRALLPKEELDILINIKPSDDILNKRRYRPYKQDANRSIQLLIVDDIYSAENQAVVIMARNNAELVARSLKGLSDNGITISNNIRLALVRAGENVMFFAILLVELKKHINASNRMNLAEIFSSLNENTARKLTALYSTNSSYIITLSKGFSETPVTEELVDFVSDSISKTPNKRVATIFSEYEAMKKAQHTPALENAKRSRPTASTSRMFQGDATAPHSDANPNPLKKSDSHRSAKQFNTI